MNRDEIIWIMETCLLSLDDYSKEKIIEFGCPGELAEIGIKISEFLKLKEIGRLSRVKGV